MEPEKKQEIQLGKIDQAEDVISDKLKKQTDTKKIILIVGVMLVGILIGAGAFSAFYAVKIKNEVEKKLGQNPAEHRQENVHQENEFSEQPNLSEQDNEDFGTLRTIDKDGAIWKGDIKWQTPEELGNLGLTTKEIYEGQSDTSRGVKYVKVGQIEKGEYAGGDFLVISSWVSEGPMVNPDYFLAIKKGEEIVFLTEGLDDYQIDLLKRYFQEGSYEKTLLSGVVVEELVLPDQIRGENDSVKLQKNKYDQAFFNDAKLKKAFVHPQYGQVWMTDDSKNPDGPASPFELNSHRSFDSDAKQYHDIFGSEAFFIKLPDGLAVSYSLVMNVFDSSDSSNRFAVLDATWNDGTKNTQEYERNPGGCGLRKYAYNRTREIDLNTDTVVIGKTSKGEPIFGFKGINHPEFNKLYDETYWVESGEKLSRENFLKIYPEVFWVDQFGRTLAFFNSSIISPAECGKPVIYLYPEQTSEINVQVSPTGGMSISDPAYEGGWNVMADSQSNITNLKNGLKYPYLFWEGSSNMLYQTPSNGFVVAKENLNSFLDEKLSQLGLIGKEISDFKEFWLPKMIQENKPYYFVTFLPQSMIEKMAPLSVSPGPDTVIRVMMDYYGLDEFRSVPGFEIQTPTRKGFTVVEWGGMLN